MDSLPRAAGMLAAPVAAALPGLLARIPAGPAAELGRLGVGEDLHLLPGPPPMMSARGAP